ncbi:MAG: adenylate/guanylate cyclase domain-containing protein [Inquilinus sp.]|nr:adenylate/guanylate cyclase domain-containing protein [Inquilinus sp.]
MSESVTRKLTTIFCADVAGYSRLMDVDEDGTLGRLKQYRGAMAGLIGRHNGRIVNTWGDAVIAEFASPVEAVRAAVEVQHELAARNNGLADDRRMVFRIGINLGDVMVDGDDLYGEGVNIAARLQSLAEPGGVTISGTVHELVRRKFEIGFEFVGAQPVKNIAEPVPSYRLLLHGETATEQAAHPAGTAATPSPSPAMPDAGSLHEQWQALPHKAKFALTMIGFFFMINLFSGLGTLWFQWPSIPFILILVISLLARGRREKRSHLPKRTTR